MFCSLYRLRDLAISFGKEYPCHSFFTTTNTIFLLFHFYLLDLAMVRKLVALSDLEF